MNFAEKLQAMLVETTSEASFIGVSSMSEWRTGLASVIALMLVGFDSGLEAGRGMALGHL